MEKKAFHDARLNLDKFNSSGQRIVRNMEREWSLPKSRLEKLVKSLIKNAATPVSHAIKEYEYECYNHVLRGKNVKFSKKPTVFGCAVEKKHYLASLPSIDTIGIYFTKRKHRENFLHEIKSNGSIKGTSKNPILNMRFKPYSVWSTWDEEKMSEDPMDFTKTSEAKEVRSALGLPKVNTSQELLIFSYPIEKSIKPKIPTIADAGLHEYFEPSINDAPAGRTVTWRPEPFHTNKGYNNVSRPECIHDSIKIEALNLPITSRR